MLLIAMMILFGVSSILSAFVFVLLAIDVSIYVARVVLITLDQTPSYE